MLIRISFLALILVLNITQAQAQRGKNGSKTLSSGTPGPNYIVNEYTPLSADAQAGSMSISVTNANLNANNRFTTNLEAGDLVLIIQIQGASITTPDDSTYGTVSNYNGAGNYEWKEVQSVNAGANTISFACGLSKSYLASGRTQVIRVPRYTTLTIQSNAKATCPAWDGQTGGIVVIETDSDLSIQSNGSVDVSALGFRGGDVGPTANLFGGVNFYSANELVGAEKGEGIAGYVNEYDLLGGRYGRGAAANGGGGGNSHNSGGGGGANGGNPAIWTGAGNPSLTTANWAQAWNLEYAGFATSTSSGGGKGGYSFSSNNLNALTVGTFLSSWGGDWRRNNGGLGGRPLDHSTGAIFLGGGGGAGEQNNGYGGPGGNGAGAIFIRCYGNVTGTGKLLANGENGTSAYGGTFTSGTDGASGGGAGGSVVLEAVGTLSNLTIEAKGGNGGSQDVLAFVNETEGPGGGGGGGYVVLSGTGPNTTVSGGVNGTTDSNALSEFPPNGATKGGDGELITISPLLLLSASNDTLCGPGTATLTASNPITGALSWSDAFMGTTLETLNSFSPDVTTAPITYYLSSCELTQTVTATVSFSPAPIVDAGADVFLCAGQSTQLSGSGSGTLVWNSDPELDDPTLPNPTATPDDSTSYVLQVTDAYGCTANDTVIVNVGDYLNLQLMADTSICLGASVDIQISGADTYTWTIESSLNVDLPDAPIATPDTTTMYHVNASSSGGCSALDSLRIEVFEPVAMNIIGGGEFCDGSSALLEATGASTVVWFPTTGLSDPNLSMTAAAPSDSTWYHASGTDTHGCAVSSSDSVLVFPGISPQAGFSFLQINNFEVVFTNTSSNAIQTFWTINDQLFTTFDCTYNFPFDDTYDVELIVKNDCGSDTIQTTIEVIKIVGIEDINANQLKFYPNPVQEQISIHNPWKNAQSVQVNMFDSVGKLVLQNSSSDALIQLSLKDLAPGIYYLELVQGQSILKSRFVHTR